MSIIDIGVKFGGRGGGRDEKNMRTYRREYVVTTNNPNDDEVSILLDPLIPQIGDSFPSDPEARVKKVDPRQRANSLTVWDVEVVWDTNVPEPDNSQSQPTPGGGKPKFDPDNPNPALRPDEVWISGVNVTKVVERGVENSPLFGDFISLNDRDFDTFGTVGPIVNSAGVQFDPLPEIDDSNTVIRVIRNYDNQIDPNELISFRNTITSTDIVIGDVLVLAYTGLMRSVDIGTRKQENGFDYMPVSFQIEVDENGWDLVILDRGFSEIPTGQSFDKLKKIVLDDGSEPLEPVLLDGEGGASTDGDDKYGHWRVRTAKDWGALQLPESLF